MKTSQTATNSSTLNKKGLTPEQKERIGQAAREKLVTRQNAQAR